MPEINEHGRVKCARLHVRRQEESDRGTRDVRHRANVCKASHMILELNISASRISSKANGLARIINGQG